MADALVWQLIRENNSFLVKRERTARRGAVQFSKEPGNLLNVNSSKYSGIANEKVINISGLSVSTKDAKLGSKPKSMTTVGTLNLHKKKSLAKIAAITKSYRPDLTSAAKIRFNKVYNNALTTSGKKKGAKKATKRSKKV